MKNGWDFESKQKIFMKKCMKLEVCHMIQSFLGKTVISVLFSENIWFE
jgi:hypothetical protein